MTGYTVHTGSTEQFSDGWERVFGGKSGKQKKSKKAAASAKTSRKKPAKKRPAFLSNLGNKPLIFGCSAAWSVRALNAGCKSAFPSASVIGFSVSC